MAALYRSRLLPLLLLAGQALWSIELRTESHAVRNWRDGQNKGSPDIRTGRNYLAHPSPFPEQLPRGDRRIASTGVHAEGDLLRVTFGESRIEVMLHVRALPRYLTFELVKVGGAPSPPSNWPTCPSPSRST